MIKVNGGGPSLSTGASPGGGPHDLHRHHCLPPLPTQEACPCTCPDPSPLSKFVQLFVPVLATTVEEKGENYLYIFSSAKRLKFHTGSKKQYFQEHAMSRSNSKFNVYIKCTSLV